jgi:hypothetical protein
VNSIICLWSLAYDDKKWLVWTLAEAYRVDDDGLPLMKADTDEHDWLHEPVSRERCSEGCECILGRAVTSWTIESGVRLRAFNPPDWVGWLTPWFYKTLCKDSRWMDIEGAGKAWMETAAQAEKLNWGE